MTTTQMTVTKALSSLSLLDKRINRGTYDSEFIGYVVGQEKKVNHTDIQKFETEVKGNYDSVIDLISYRNKIKSAIVASNAVTKVTIAGIEYTVAEAIERKTSIQYEQELLHRMKTKYTSHSSEVDRINERVQSRLDESLKAMLSNDGKQDNEFINQFTENYNKKNRAKLIDPLIIKEKIETLETSIEDFLSEVDHELSVSNATTTITIED